MNNNIIYRDMTSLMILMIYALLGVIFGVCTRSTIEKHDRMSWYTISTVIWPIMLGYHLTWKI